MGLLTRSIAILFGDERSDFIPAHFLCSLFARASIFEVVQAALKLHARDHSRCYLAVLYVIVLFEF
jgi:hypothetical protein